MTDLAGNPTPEASPRTRRFPIQTILRYRVACEQKWWQGTTENISDSGVLFRTDHLVPLSTPVEMSFVLPVETSPEPPAEVVCQGKVVRALPPSGAQGLPALAVRISDYRFLRR